MTDVLSLLHAPLGVKGSGRVRYGAAMALWRDGQISAEVLETYLSLIHISEPTRPY